MLLNSIPRVKLVTGAEIPQLGLGTSHHGGFSEETFRGALGLGVRLIDTAQRYGTEEAIGQCIARTGIERSELFLTTKLWPQNYGTCSEATARSLSNLNTDYLDLYLLHWPQAFDGTSITQVWRSLELLLESGKVRAIGVSNFLERHLGELSYTVLTSNSPSVFLLFGVFILFQHFIKKLLPKKNC